MTPPGHPSFPAWRKQGPISTDINTATILPSAEHIQGRRTGTAPRGLLKGSERASKGHSPPARGRGYGGGRTGRRRDGTTALDPRASSRYRGRGHPDAPACTTEGIEAALAIRREFPATTALLLSQYIETGSVLDLVGRPVSRPHHERPPLDRLSAREREVPRLMAEGRYNRAIGAALFLGERTVETHVLGIFVTIGLQPEPDDHRRASRCSPTCGPTTEDATYSIHG